MAAIHQTMDRTEQAVLAEIAAMPDGTYRGESSTDDDGTVLDEPVTVRVDVTIRGSDIVMDFSRSDAQRKGFTNCVYAVIYATRARWPRPSSTWTRHAPTSITPARCGRSRSLRRPAW